MENEKNSTRTFAKIGGAWLEEVSKLSPELGKPELWSDELINSVIAENEALCALIHMVSNSVLMSGPRRLEAALWAATILGYHLGQLAIRKAN